MVIKYIFTTICCKDYFIVMDTKTPLSIRYVRMGALPIIQQIIDTLGIEGILRDHVKHDTRDKIPVSRVLASALCNVILERYPLYKMGHWAMQRGLVAEDMADCFNDDRIGRALDRLFVADRAALIGAVTVKAIKTFSIDTGRIHNDATSIKLFGNYTDYEDVNDAAKPARSQNSKDHRPDLKQVVFSLSVAGDGAVPLYFKVWDGNTTDDTTHLSNWMSLRALVGHAKFIYVADCKLCVKDTMLFIDAEGGLFVTVMPETRLEINRFQQWIQTNSPQWQEALRLPNTHEKDGPPRQFWTYDSPFLSSEGFRIIWVKSSAKQFEDEQRRTLRIERTEEALRELSAKAHRNHDRLAKTVAAILKKYRTETYFEYQIVNDIEETFKQQQRGRPTENTKFRKVETVTYRLSWCQKPDRVQYDARYDGIFPLITNHQKPAAEILKIYKYQPYLEKRHEQLKSVYNVAPVFLRNPQRIESLLLLYFLGMLITALIERKVRKEMEIRNLPSIPIYPEGRACKSPTSDKLIGLFSDVRLQYICRDKDVLQIVPDEFTKVQALALDLIGLKPVAFYKTG
jgi:transposase